MEQPLKAGLTILARCSKIPLGGSLTTLHSFASSEGYQPAAPLVQGNDGNFDGTTTNGGTNTYGTIFKMSSGGHADDAI